MSQDKSSMNYADAGVNIHAGNQLVERIKPFVKKTLNSNVLTHLGGFAALFELPEDIPQPVLVASSDGVGTKLKLALQLNQLESIGIDLVAMCVNDLLCCGAKPLFFLDYYASGQLDIEMASTVIKSISEGCLQAQCALIGGETAEMPSVYHAQDFDLAGFSVGAVSKSHIIDGHSVQAGDKLIGIAASGPHANGFSLIRHILANHKINLEEKLANQKQSIAELLLTPTKIYVSTILELQKKIDLHAIAHITGGGIVENLPRVLPQGVQARINPNAWQRPAIFNWLQQLGQIEDDEMWRVFNNGIGLILSVHENDAQNTLAQLHAMGESAWHIGDIISAPTPTATPSVQFSAVA